MKAGLVIVPSPGRGHLVSTVEFAKRINQHNRFSITVLVVAPPTSSSSTLSASLGQSVAASGFDLHLIDIVPKHFEAEGPVPHISAHIARHADAVREFVLRLRSSIRVVALVVDFFATAVAEVGDELGIPVYLFYTSGAASLALLLHLPTLDSTIHSDFEVLEEGVEVPGLGEVAPLILPMDLGRKNTELYWWLLEHGRNFRQMRGIIANTFPTLEPAALAAVESGLCVPDHPMPPVFPVGPVLSFEERDAMHPCIRWLDSQPPGSVVFLCFGSMGALAGPQVMEIALGLENSGHRFLWSVRTRRSEGFEPPEDADLVEIMPEGFVNRTADVGMVWPSWAPQTAILAHEAVGGFVSHCGWNSCLESVWFGVPVLTWPLFAEQRLNGWAMAREIGVAVEVEMDYRGGGTVPASVVEKGVRCLMGDSEIAGRVRSRAMELKAASRAALEDGGSSAEAVSRLIDQLLADSDR